MTIDQDPRVQSRIAALPEVQDFFAAFAQAQGNVSGRRIAVGAGWGSSSVSRYTTKVVARDWKTYDGFLRVIEHFGGIEPDYNRIRSLWAKANAAAGQVRTNRRAEVLTITEPETVKAVVEAAEAARGAHADPVVEMTEVGRPVVETGEAHQPDTEAKIVIIGGRVVITDAAVVNGKVVEIHGGEVYLSGSAAEMADRILVHGGEVIIGEPTQEKTVSAGKWVIESTPSLPEPAFEYVKAEPPEGQADFVTEALAEGLKVVYPTFVALAGRLIDISRRS